MGRVCHSIRDDSGAGEVVSIVAAVLYCRVELYGPTGLLLAVKLYHVVCFTALPKRQALTPATRTLTLVLLLSHRDTTKYLFLVILEHIVFIIYFWYKVMHMLDNNFFGLLSWLSKVREEQNLYGLIRDIFSYGR